MAETHDLSNPFDRQTVALEAPQIRKLCFILGGMYDLHPLPSKDNMIHPTFQICPAAFIRYLIVRLSKAMAQDNLRILDVRLAGGAASHIINPTANDPHNMFDKFNDLDFVFNLEVDESTDHAVAYDRIRDLCVECLREFSPMPVQNLSLIEFAKLYVFKQMRIMCSKDEDNCWVLVSTNNKFGKTIDLLFVHKMRRRFIFPTDSFRIILEDSFLAMVQHARESVQSPSCAHIPSVAMHVEPPPPISISTSTRLDINSSNRRTKTKPKVHGEESQRRSDEGSDVVVERLAHIHPSPPHNHEQDSDEHSTEDGPQSSSMPVSPPDEVSSKLDEARPERSSAAKSDVEQQAQVDLPPPDQNRSNDALALSGQANEVNGTPEKKNESPLSTTKTTPQTPKTRGRKKRRQRRKKKRNSQSQSRLDEVSSHTKREHMHQRSAGSAPPAEVPASRENGDGQDGGRPSPSHDSVQNGSVGSTPRLDGALSHEQQLTPPTAHRRGVSLDGANTVTLRRSVFYDTDDLETRKAQSLPPTFETETNSFEHRSETPPSSLSSYSLYGRHPSTVNASVQTDGSVYDDDSSSRRGSTTSTTSSPGRSSVAMSSGSGMTQYNMESVHHPNWHAWVRSDDYPNVLSLALYESYSTALEDLKSQRIRFYRPEEVRGGGLLKYCELLQRKYTLCDEQMERKEYYEQLILNRFVNIDYIDVNDQRAAINTFLMRHFRHRTVEAIYFLINIKKLVGHLQELSEQYQYSAASLLEIVETLDTALREAVRINNHRNNQPSVSNANGASQQHLAQARRRAQQAQQAQVQAAQKQQAAQLYSTVYNQYPHGMYTGTQAVYPIYRHSIGMLAQPQYHYQSQWRPSYQHAHSAFISVPALPAYGGFGRSHRAEYESKDEEVGRRRKSHHYNGGRSNQRTNGHHSTRYSNHGHNSPYRSRANGRKSAN